jgi:2-keto-4-pentenoate hydratase
MNFEAAANELFDMRARHRVIPTLPSDQLPTNQEDAYRIQAALVERMLAANRSRPIGYKAAATNDLAQKQLHVTAPFSGRLMSHSTFRTGTTLPAGDFTVRIIEPEFGFLIGADVPPSATPYTKDTIAPFVAAVIPAIEIVSHRYTDWTAVGAPSLIADNAIHGAWIEGDPVSDWRSVDLANHATKLIVNGEVIRNGSGAAVLGHPLIVVAWLANTRPLRAGDKLTTGTTTAVHFTSAGERITADFGSFGTAEVAFG